MEPNSVTVNGLTLSSVTDVQAALKAGQITQAQAQAFALLFPPKEENKGGTEVEHAEDQPLTEEQQAVKQDARQKELDEIAAMKEKSKDASDAGRFATDTDALRRQQEKYNTKEKAQEHFGLGDKFKDRRAAKKIAKAANQNIESMNQFDALEKIYTNKEEYKAAVEKAKQDGTWDKDNPKYTLLDGKPLEGARHLQEAAAKKVEDALKSYRLNEEIYNNAKTPEDKRAAFEVMKQAAAEINDNYLASQMFDKDGNVNTEAYQKAMLQYAGSDFKGNIDERKVLAKDADVKKRHTDNMLEAGGLDAEKDYTWAMRAGVFVAGLGSGALAGLLGGGATATAVATAVATATSSATATAHSSATAELDVNIPTPGGEYNAFITTTVENTVTTTVVNTATSTVTDTATKAISNGTKALNGLLGSAIPSILAALAVKDNGGKDVFNGAAVMDVLENPDQVKGRQNKTIMNQLVDMEITGDPVRDKIIKAALLNEAMSDKTGKKVNTRELLAAYAAAEELKDHPELVTPEKNEEVTTPPSTTPPTTTEVDVFDITGNGFTDENGGAVAVIENGKTKEAQGSRGHARDIELLKKRNAPVDSNDPNAKAQYVIANEKGEISVTGNYESPDTITIKDNTNNKVNSYEYRKLTDAEIAAGKTKDGQTISGLEGRQGPFYVLVSATDAKGSLKTKHLEVFQLNLVPKEEVIEEKDEKGNIVRTTIHRYDYQLEQYKGMSGSGTSSMFWWRRK